MKNKFHLIMSVLFVLLCNSANSQIGPGGKELKTKNITQLVQHEFATTYCPAGNYTVQLMVSYSLGGMSYNVISPAVSNLAGGSSAMLSVNVISTAVVTAKKIKIVCEGSSSHIWDLSSDNDDFINHPLGLDWLSCINSDYIHFSDYGDTFLFGFTSVLGR